MLTSPPELTPLEQEVLEEYERLAENMKKVRFDSSLTHSLNPRFTPLALLSISIPLPCSSPFL
jgi:hypothetical protein